MKPRHKTSSGRKKPNIWNTSSTERELEAWWLKREVGTDSWQWLRINSLQKYTNAGGGIFSFLLFVLVIKVLFNMLNILLVFAFSHCIWTLHMHLWHQCPCLGPIFPITRNFFRTCYLSPKLFEIHYSMYLHLLLSLGFLFQVTTTYYMRTVVYVIDCSTLPINVHSWNKEFLYPKIKKTLFRLDISSDCIWCSSLSPFCSGTLWRDCIWWSRRPWPLQGQEASVGVTHLLKSGRCLTLFMYIQFITSQYFRVFPIAILPFYLKYLFFF